MSPLSLSPLAMRYCQEEGPAAREHRRKDGAAGRIISKFDNDDNLNHKIIREVLYNSYLFRMVLISNYFVVIESMIGKKFKCFKAPESLPLILLYQAMHGVTFLSLGPPICTIHQEKLFSHLLNVLASFRKLQTNGSSLV